MSDKVTLTDFVAACGAADLDDVTDRALLRGKYKPSAETLEKVRQMMQPGRLEAGPETLTMHERLRLIEIAASDATYDVRQAAMRLLEEAQAPLVVFKP